MGEHDGQTDSDRTGLHPSDNSGETDGDGVALEDETGPDVRPEGDGARRDVIVPLAIYKRVTVVSTVLASGLVVGGFLLLDAGTKQTRLLRGPIEAIFRWVGIEVSAGALSAALGLTGIAVIVAGAAVYVFGARFRTAGMGSDKPEDGEETNNG